MRKEFVFMESSQKLFALQLKLVALKSRLARDMCIIMCGDYAMTQHTFI